MTSADAIGNLLMNNQKVWDLAQPRLDVSQI